MRRVAIVSCLAALCGVALAQEQGRAARESTEERAVTQKIYNYVKVDDRLVTAGQPSEEQLRAAADEGFKHVINLAPTSSRNALPDEANVVRSVGMTYHYIPVDWEKPTDADFDAFERAMREAGAEKTLVHCAANYRATAFYSLYAQKHLGWTVQQAEALRASIWKGGDYPVWDDFIRRTQARIAGAVQ